MPRLTLALSDTQWSDLTDCRDHHPVPAMRERAAAMLVIAAGESPHAGARRGVLRPRHPDTVYGWLKWYRADGVAGWERHLPGGARRRSL